MKLIITESGVRRAGEELAKGAEIEIEGDVIPASLINKVQPVGGRIAITNPAEGGLPQPAAYEAKHRGAGSYSVLDADGAEVVSKLTREDAEAFNALSDEDKAAFVASEADKQG